MADFLNARNTKAFSLDSWLVLEWNRYLREHNKTGPTILSAWQSLFLWETIINDASCGLAFFKARSVARLAKEAFELCHHWQLPSFEPETDDHAAFLTWSRTYQACCEASHWIDPAVIIDALIEAHQCGLYAFPKEITTIGFESLNISPQFKRFLSLAAIEGSDIHERSLLSKPGNIQRVRSLDPDEEILFAVKMADLWLKQNPDCRICIVAPDLSRQRKTIARILKENLEDDACYNIAAPVSLASYPLVDAALLGLRLFLSPLSFEDVSLFLRSPFVVEGMTESLTRAKVDAFLRTRGEETLSFAYLCDLPSMTESLKPCLDIFPTLKGRALSIHWYQCIQTILDTLGWLKSRALDSDEQQQHDKWQALLVTYRDATSLWGEHTFRDALMHLQYLAQETAFLPRAHHPDAPIQVLGLLEALGLPFDYVWVMGLHQQSWPQMPDPHPFIPISLQKKQDLPRSSSKREYLFAREVTERLCQAAPNVIFSQALSLDDEPCEASSLLTDFPVITIEALGFARSPSYLQQQFDARKSLTLTSHDFAESAPKLGGDEKLRMGTHVLKLQTLCPFRAFAENRLQARSLDTVLLGLRPNERGEIVHQILYEFWKDLKDKASLESLSQDALNGLLQSKINHVLSRFQQKYQVRIKDSYLQLEKERLQFILLQLLALEKTRDDFEVMELEKAHDISIGPLQFTIRMDRIDKVNGEEVLIDYKTGHTSLSDWFADDIQEPQLPLYSITRDKAPLGLAFAVVRADGVKFQGIVNTDEDIIPGIKRFSVICDDKERTWAEQQLIWRENLENKAFAFYEGIAKVEPLQGESTCRLCDLKPLCRINSKVESA